MLVAARIMVVVAASALGSAVAEAHAYPTTSVPAKGATLHVAPTEVAIEFDDELEAKFSTIVVHDAKGAAVSTGSAHVPTDDPKHLAVALKPLPPGVYTVIWHAIDIDTHKTKGSFSFTIAP